MGSAEVCVGNADNDKCGNIVSSNKHCSGKGNMILKQEGTNLPNLRASLNSGCPSDALIVNQRRRESETVPALCMTELGTKDTTLSS